MHDLHYISKQIVDSITDPLIVLNENYEYIFVNKAIERVSKKSAEEFKGKTFWQMYGGLKQTKFADACAKVLKEKVPVYHEEYFPAYDIWAEQNIYPFENGITILFKNITKRKNKELDDLKLIRRNSLMMQSMGDMYILVDAHLNIIDVNTSTCEALEYQAEELYGMNLSQIDSRFGKEELKEVITNGTRPATPFVDTKIKSKSNKEIVVELVIIELQIDSGQHYGLIGRDITELNKAYELLDQSNERFKLISNITQDGLWDVFFENNSMWANEVHQQYYGLTEKDPVPSEAEWRKRIHPNDRDHIITSDEIASNKELNNLVQEYRFYTENRGWINIYDRTYIIRNEDGKVIRALGSMLDVTKLTEARQKAVTEKNLSDSIINSMPTTFYLLSDEGKPLRWNEQFKIVSGYSDEEIPNMTALDFFAPEDQPAIEDAMQQAQGNKLIEAEANILTKEKQKIPFYFTGKKIILEGKKYLLGTGTNLTLVKEAQKKMKKMEAAIAEQRIEAQKKITRAIIKAQEKERNHLAAELHDNVNQLLAGTRLYLNMAAKTSESAREAIAYPLELLDQTIQEIRILSRKYVAPQKHVNLKKLITTLLETMQNSAGIQTELTYEMGEAEIGDELKINLYRILQEQTNNIIKHACASKVFLHIYTKAGKINIITTDNGKGCDLKQNKEGVGLSNIVNRVESYNGQINFKNAIPHGFSIEIEIPVQQSEPKLHE